MESCCSAFSCVHTDLSSARKVGRKLRLNSVVRWKFLTCTHRAQACERAAAGSPALSFLPWSTCTAVNSRDARAQGAQRRRDQSFASLRCSCAARRGCRACAGGRAQPLREARSLGRPRPHRGVRNVLTARRAALAVSRGSPYLLRELHLVRKWLGDGETRKILPPARTTDSATQKRCGLGLPAAALQRRVPLQTSPKSGPPFRAHEPRHETPRWRWQKARTAAMSGAS